MPKGSKVLMADDDKMLLDMYKERLELAGYNVESAYNGEELLGKVHDFSPNIIMLDVMMPRMNGYETLASLKSDPSTKNIPVVMLSALMRDFNREKAVEGGAEDYLIKSEAMPSDVITKIEQVLQKYGSVAAVSSAPAPAAQPAPIQPAAPDAMSAKLPVEPGIAVGTIETQPVIDSPKMIECTPEKPEDLPKPKIEINPPAGAKAKSPWLPLIIIMVILVVILTAAFYLLVFKKI